MPTQEEQLHTILFELSLKAKKLGALEEAREASPVDIASKLDRVVTVAFKEILKLQSP